MLNAEGVELDFTFSLELVQDTLTLVIESGGGAKGSPSARNLDYNDGLELILKRLGEIGAFIENIALDTRKTRHLPLEERSLRVRDRPYPIVLRNEPDTHELRRAISKAQRRPDNAGNPTKRIRLFLGIPAQARDLDILEGRLVGGSTSGHAAVPVIDTPSPEIVRELEEAAGVADARKEFDADDEADARQKILRAIALRQGQPRFRRDLLRAYRGRCAISGCSVSAVLEAAHIMPFHGESTNHVQNGLLLRGDLHTLLDRGLITIDEETWEVLVHPDLRETPYGGFHGRCLSLPINERDRPSRAAIGRHRMRTWASEATKAQGTCRGSRGGTR